MLLHVIRWFTAFINLALSSLCLWFWLVVLPRNVNYHYNKVEDLLLLSAFALMSIAGTSAAILLSRRRTARMGINYHWLTSLSWPIMTAGLLTLTLKKNSHLFPSDWLLLYIMTSVTLVWTALGITLKHLLRADTSQKSLSRNDTVAADLRSVSIPILPTAATALQETKPIVLGRRT